MKSPTQPKHSWVFMLVVGVMGLSTGASFAQSNVTAVVNAANAFLTSLGSSSNTALCSLTLSNAGAWSNLPVGAATRNGPQFSTLTAVQVGAALNVGTNALSAMGATLFNEIRLADSVIATVNSSMWGSNKYYIAFVGTPSTNSPWTLQLGGHHMAYNMTFNGTNISGTPMFTGTEPNTWTNNSVVHAPLGAQRSAIIALRQTLTASALLSGTFSDVVFGPNGTGNHDTIFPKAYPTTGRGQLYTSLSSSEQALVKAYVTAWVTNMHSAIATSLLADYFTDAALAETYIGYSGSSTDLTTQSSYFRVDGPRCWIEFVCQGGVAYPSSVHDHGVWRDKLTDYGMAYGSTTISTTNTLPTLTTQPSSRTNIAGSSTNFVVAATGTGTMYYQWYKDSVAIGGATNAAYNIASITAGDAGVYFAKVWNHMGIKSSSNATLTVNAGSVNTAPTLNAVSDCTITPGTSLLITNVAADSDMPAQTLTFSLLAAPTNATINSSSGVLSWRPFIAQADSTNGFSVSVADSGSPALSATNSFNVFVSAVVYPTNLAASYAEGVYQMQVGGDAGPDYTIQASTNLVDWNSLLTTNPPATPFIWSDSDAAAYPIRYYRILLGP